MQIPTRLPVIKLVEKTGIQIEIVDLEEDTGMGTLGEEADNTEI